MNVMYVRTFGKSASFEGTYSRNFVTKYRGRGFEQYIFTWRGVQIFASVHKPRILFQIQPVYALME